MNMVLKFIFNVLLLATCFLLSGTALLADPCPSDVDDNRVATMCTNSSGEEETHEGSYTADGVVLRIMKQQTGCVCNITVEYLVKSPAVLFLRKYDELKSSAPTTASCGLEIDVENITVSGNNEALDSITCLTGYGNRSFTYPDEHTFTMTSRKTDAEFAYGYCLQIYRELKNATPSTLKIACFEPIGAMSTIEATTNVLSQLSTKSTDTNKSGTSDIPKTMTGLSSTVYMETQTDSNSALEEGRLKLYIIAGSSAGGCLITIFILGFVVCKCRRKKSNHNGRTHNKHPPDESEDNDSYGLTDNVLYVSSNVQETCIGNYSAVELETQSTDNNQLGFGSTCINSVNQKEEDNVVLSETKKFKPALKPKPSNSEATIGNGGETNALEYAVVNKKPILQVDHVTPACSSNEYAVVNKIWKT